MYRSPIAAEVFRGLLLLDEKRKHWQVGSAGTWTTEGRPAPGATLEFAKTLGADLTSHQTRMVDQTLMKEYDLVVVMEEGHKESLQVEFPFAYDNIHLLGDIAQGAEYDIPDPAKTPDETKVILQEVTDMVRAGYEKICALAE